MAKVTISINDELLAKVDTYADSTYNTRSGVITLALSSLIQSQELTKAMNEMTIAMQKIADTHEVDDEIIEQLADYERLARLFNSSRR